MNEEGVICLSVCTLEPQTTTRFPSSHSDIDICFFVLQIQSFVVRGVSIDVFW